MARQGGWRVLLRIEDLDSPRVKRGSDREAMEVLGWLGMDWDEGPMYQSAEMGVYREAMERLARAGVAYASGLSRGEIEAAGTDMTGGTGDSVGASGASAPQEGSHEVAFPASLRPAVIGSRRFDEEANNWRLVVEAGGAGVKFEDVFAGRQSFDVARIVGDFLVWTKRGVPAYQLAVVVDDARQGVTQVVRGDDLLDSTARQMLVARALGLEAWKPRFTHVPLVRGVDGKRLAKRHGDTRIGSYRGGGVRAERIIGLIAAWSGVLPRGGAREMGAAEFRDRFDLTRMPRESVVMTPEDEQWLADRSQ